MSNIKTYRRFLYLLAVVSIFATCRNDGKRIMPRMSPRYMYRDKEPMGTNIAYRLLPQQFNADITLASKKIGKLTNEFAYARSTVYISIGKNIQLGDEELEQLLNYVNRGNEFFIAASDIDYRLLDTMGIKRDQETFAEDSTGTDIFRNTFLRISDSVAYGKKQHGFFYYPFRDFFTAYDSSRTKVLGINGNGHPNFIVVKFGKGKFYFHLAPAAFTNYFLLTANNTDYYQQVFSYLSKDASAVYWADTDRFGKTPDGFSALSMFWKNPPLKYALLIACALILLYIAFGSKRKRRLVPELPPNNNDSISFVHTIGNLYLQKKDNRNIAVKMMIYFLEYIRSHYYLSTNNINKEFVQALSRKSGVDEVKVQALMEKAAYVNDAEAITDQELFDINNLMYEFYKR